MAMLGISRRLVFTRLGSTFEWPKSVFPSEARPMQYDPKIIIEFAERLYAQARAIVLRAGLLGGLLGETGRGI